MELAVILVLLALALHQFWTGHKKDKAGNTKAGRIHMVISLVLIVIGILFTTPLVD